jgi:NADH dehydrogenase
MWGFIHMLYLIGWGNRLGTLYTWLRGLVFSNNRGHRIISYDTTNRELSAERRLTAAILPPEADGSDR